MGIHQRRFFKEVIAVVLVCATIVGIALPLYARTEAEVRGDLATNRLNSVRDAIELFKETHGRLPGADRDQEAFKSELKEFLGEFPACPVGDALFPREVEIVSSEEELSGGFACSHGWKYNASTGEFIINYRGARLRGDGEAFDSL